MSPTTEPRPTEIVFIGGKVLTVDASFSIAAGVAVRDGRIVAVGSEDAVRSAVSAGSQVVDLAGRTVIPGMIDAHAHMDSWWRNYPSLRDCRSIKDIQATVSALASMHRPGEWIVLRQLADPEDKAPHNLAEGRYPNRHDLDLAAPDNPVWIIGTYSAPSIANSAALALGGVTRNTPQPQRLERVLDSRTTDWIPSPGGRIDIDASTGEPTGVLYDHDMLLAQPTTAGLARHLAVPSHGDRVEYLRDAVNEFNSLGITAIHEGHGVSSPVGECTRAYLDLWSRGELTVRTQLVPNLATGGPIEEVIAQLDQLSYASHQGAGDDLLRFAGVGVTLDGPGGALDSVQPKAESWPGPHDEIREGVRRMSRSTFAAIAEEAARRGFRLSTKAGGEPMVDWVLDVYGDADARWGIHDRRWLMIHSQFTQKRQMARLRDLGVAVATCANFIWNHGATYVAGYGREVAGRSVPFRSFLDAGVAVANESDTTPKSPMFALWLMTTRTDGVTGECLGPDQRITREQALRVLTNNGASLLGMEDRVGSIEVGKYADLVVLADDLLGVDDERVKDLEVDATMMGGRFVYMRAGTGLSVTAPAAVSGRR